MVGTPMASRWIRTGALTPSTVRERSSGGSEDCSQSSPEHTAMIGDNSRTIRMRRPMLVRTRADCPRSAQVQDDGLLLREMFEHGLERSFLAEPRLLHAAIGHVRLHHEVLVHLDQPSLEPVARVERSLEVARPDGGGKPIIAVVGLRQRVL